MQKHNIIINKRFKTNGPVVNSGLDLQNNYYVYTQNLGGGLTSEFNVRAYLNDPQNQLIIDQFIVFIKGATTEAEFLEIFYDDSKLQAVFNKFFESELQGQQVSVTAAIDESLANTISIIVNDGWFKWEGDVTTKPMTGLPESLLSQIRIDTPREELVPINIQDSYYIPVKLNFSHSQLPRSKFKVCNDYVDSRLNPVEHYLTSQGLTDIQSGEMVRTFLNLINPTGEELPIETNAAGSSLSSPETSEER